MMRLAMGPTLLKVECPKGAKSYPCAFGIVIVSR